jgi:hypothetical protein
MMIALFSDIHANIEAFRSVLDDATNLGVTKWYCLGDTYDIEAAQRRYLEAGLVSRNADRLERGE